MTPIELGPQEQIAADQFRLFYAGLLSLRDVIHAASTAPLVAATVVPMADPDPALAVQPTAVAVVADPSIAPVPPAPAAIAVRPPTVDALRVQLLQSIADLGYRRDETLGEGPVDAGYVLAALADEVILGQCPDWVDYDAWADRPLEAVIFGTRLAGDRLFDAGDELAARRRTDPRAATMILLALLTGFRGRYLGDDGDRTGKARIDVLQRRLYALVCGRNYAADDRLPYATPDLAASALTGSSVRSLPALWPWLVALVIVIVAYFPVSHLLWWQQVHSIDLLADTIVAGDPVAGRTGLPPP